MVVDFCRYINPKSRRGNIVQSDKNKSRTFQIIALAIIGLGLLPNAMAQEATLEGYWSGIIGGANPGKIVVEFTKHGDFLSGTLEYSFEFGFFSSGLGELQIRGSRVSFVSQIGEFSGEISNDGKTLSGLVNTGAETLPLELEKTTRPQSEFGEGWFSEFDGGTATGQEEFEKGQAFDGQGLLIFVIWLLFWITVSIFLLRFFKQRKKMDLASSREFLEQSELEPLKDLLPVVRLKRKNAPFIRDRVVILYDDSMVLFRKRKRRSIASLHEKNSKKELTRFKGLKKRKVIPLDAIEKVRVEKASRLGKMRFKVKARIKNRARKFKFELPYYETPKLILTLKTLLGQRIETDCPISFHRGGTLVFMALFSLIVILPFLEGITITASSGTSLWMAVAVLTGITLIILSFPALLWTLDHLHLKSADAATKKSDDLSDRRPFRSVSLAIILKLAAVAMLILGFFVWKLDTFWTYIIVGNMLMLGHALAQRDPNTSKSKREPILYLRSFLDDRETTFNPRSWLSAGFGVEPPYYLLDQYELEAGTKLYRFLTLAIRYIYNYHPTRLLRLLIGRPLDTSEQQLGNFLGKHGFFVAIGKPGERIVTTGAARTYVSNDEWQQTVIDLMEESKFVVLQPSRTAGVWWEVEQALARMQPGKILLCLVNYKHRQDDYETFRFRMEKLHPNIRLPLSIGNEHRIAFLRFDEKWHPETLNLKYLPAIIWPFTGRAVNLKNTLKHFLTDLDQNYGDVTVVNHAKQEIQKPDMHTIEKLN